MAKQVKLDYNPEDYQEENPDFDLPLLSELLGEVIEIREIRFGESAKGTYAVLTLETGSYRTSSKVLVDKLVKMHDTVNAGTVIVARLEKKTGSGGTYHEFQAPK